MAIREARWDCQYCGTKGNLGRNKSCHHCGRSRPGGTKFYLPEDAAEVTEEHILDQAGKGPDWICSFCGTSNRSEASTCRACGAARESTSGEQEVTVYAPGEVPRSGDMTIEETRQPAATSREPEDRKKLKPLIIIGAIVLGIACIGLIAFLIFGGSELEATVSGYEWQRSVDIEAFQTVTEEDWAVPDGGRILDERQEVHHTDQVLDHNETREEVCGQIDLGDGFFEDKICTVEEPVYRDEDVYQTKYTYEIDKWVVIRTAQESGADHSPFWPRSNLDNDEREGDRSESYKVLFKDSEGEIRAFEVAPEEWDKYENGQGVILKLNALGGVSRVER